MREKDYFLQFFDNEILEAIRAESNDYFVNKYYNVEEGEASKN
jgi:hypothetical protein